MSKLFAILYEQRVSKSSSCLSFESPFSRSSSLALDATGGNDRTDSNCSQHDRLSRGRSEEPETLKYCCFGCYWIRRTPPWWLSCCSPFWRHRTVRMQQRQKRAWSVEQQRNKNERTRAGAVKKLCVSTPPWRFNDDRLYSF